MTVNSYFTRENTNDQDLYESLIIESIQIHGYDVLYLPRTVISKNKILGEPDQSKFSSAYPIEMYIESYDAFAGEGSLFQKFGLESRDQLKLIVSRLRWKQSVGQNLSHFQNRPFEGDLIYFPMFLTLYEIKFVEHEEPFYQLDNLPIYKLQTEMFEYSGERFETGIWAIDKTEYLYGSGGIQMLVQSNLPLNINIEQDVNKGIEFSQISGQDTATGKLYVISRESESPLVYKLSLGQITGIFNVSSTDFLISTKYPGIQFEILRVFNITDSDIAHYDDDIIFPHDLQASNVSLEKESDQIRSFEENNPFGDF